MLTARAALEDQGRPRGQQARQEEGLVVRHRVSPRRLVQPVALVVRPSHAHVLHLQPRRRPQQIPPRWPYPIWAGRTGPGRRCHQQQLGTRLRRFPATARRRRTQPEWGLLARWVRHTQQTRPPAAQRDRVTECAGTCPCVPVSSNPRTANG